MHSTRTVYMYIYRESVGNVGACAVSMYQALSPPLKWPGYEAILEYNTFVMLLLLLL